MNQSIQKLVADHEIALHQLCTELAVQELRLFGSAITDAFDPSRSDIDIVVQFFDSEAPGISDRYFALADGLEKIFQRPVDLVTRQSIKNPIFRETVNSTSQPLYAA